MNKALIGIGVVVLTCFALGALVTFIAYFAVTLQCMIERC